jgi:uncharacterized delta-60 repeat protein
MHWKNFALCSLSFGLSLAACGDDAKQQPADAAVPTPDTALPIDAAPDAPGYMAPMAVPIDLSAGGPDQLQSIIPGPDNGFYLAGFFAEAPTGPKSLLVIKALANGAADKPFGNRAQDSAADDGVAEIREVAFAGGNDEIDVAVQADGKIVVSATVAHDSGPDHDIAVVRLLPTGVPDTTFGVNGVSIVDLNNALDPAAVPSQLDTARGIAVTDSGIFVHALSRGLGTTRTDTDFVVVKLSLTDGSVDESFGDQSTDGKKGQFRLAPPGSTTKAARAIHALPDGELLAVGYANSPALTIGNQPVIYKLTRDGALDATFNPSGAVPGLFHAKVDGRQTEVYNIAIHDDKFVTGGYGGAEGSTTDDYISLRFDLATGARDTTWGGAPDGIVKFDPSGSGLSSNCRGAFALPAGKTLLVGSTGGNTAPGQDAVFAVLDATGKLDTGLATYGTGINKYKLGSDGADQFWNAAVSGAGVVAIVGWTGVGNGAQQTAGNNDNAWAVVFRAK